jgi:hypothetical protein
LCKILKRFTRQTIKGLQYHPTLLLEITNASVKLKLIITNADELRHFYHTTQQIIQVERDIIVNTVETKSWKKIWTKIVNQETGRFQKGQRPRAIGMPKIVAGGGPPSGSRWPLRQVSISSWQGPAANLLN